jgi:hypothetical protein
MTNTIRKVLAMAVLALGIESAQAHPSGYWGPEIQADLNDGVWTPDIAEPIKHPQAQLQVEKQKLQKLWNALTPEQKKSFISNLLEWKREVERPPDNGAENQVGLYRMRERRIQQWWLQGRYGPESDEITSNPYWQPGTTQ